MKILRLLPAVAATAVLAAPASPAHGDALDVAPDGTAHFALLHHWDATVALGSRAADGAFGPVSPMGSQVESHTKVWVQTAPSGVETVMWVQDDDATGRKLMARRRAADGTLGAPKVIADGVLSVHDGGPQMATDSRGGAYFVWMVYKPSTGAFEEHLVQGRRWRPDGSLSPVQDIGSGYYPMARPQVGVDESGTFTIAWDQKYPFAVHTRRRLTSGALGATRRVSPASQKAGHVRLAVAEDGTAAFSWVSGPDHQTATAYHARVRRLDGSFGPVLDVSAANERLHQRNHDVSIAPDGSAAAVTWSGDNQGTTTNRLYARRFDRSGELSPIRTADEGVGTTSYPQVEVDAAGNAVLAWVHGSLLSRRLRADGTLAAPATVGTDLDSQFADASAFDIGVDGQGTATFLWRTADQENLTRRRTPGGALSPVVEAGG